MQRAICALTVALGVASAHASDWPFWRGPDQTGMSREKAPVTNWSPEGENLLWKAPIEGRTTPIVMNGRVYVVGPVGDGIETQERTVCLDAESGKVLWEHRYNVFHTDIVRQRVGWPAPCGDPETGNVYVHGTGGELLCYSPDGKVLWTRSLTEEFGRVSGYGGRLNNPVIDEDRVVISFLASGWGPHAKAAHRFCALDKLTGEVVWWSAPGDRPVDTTYCTPAVGVIGGKRLMVAGTSDGDVFGIAARTGEKTFSHQLSKAGVNSSIVLDGNRAFLCHSEENYSTTEMGAVVCIDASKTGDITASGEIWRVNGLGVGYASPALANGRIYVVTNDAHLIALDANTGQKKWTHNLGRVGKGSPTVTSDGVIYVCEQNGIFHILRDAGDKCESLDVKEFPSIDGLVDEMYGSPAIANGRVYFMARSGVYCLGSGEPSSDGPKVTLDRGGESKGYSLYPADVTVTAGESVKFEIRPYGGAEQLAGAEPVWTLKGVSGKMTGDGTFSAPAAAGYSAGTVAARVSTPAGDLELSSRLRVCPKLPFSVDFEDLEPGSVPSGWISVTRKAQVEERDGGKVLRKLAPKELPSPPFMRLRTYFTPPIAGGYTVQCDMLGTPKGKRFKPDMGLINTRYRLVAMGLLGKLRLETWAALPRIQHDVDFHMETNVWYTMKFEVRLEGDKALCRGKIWPRDSAEPDAWTIEFTDPLPNTEGSAGLYAYSTGTTHKSDGPEVFYDNLKVTPHE